MNRIQELRKKKGLTQHDLATELGISSSTIGMYEQGRRDPDTKTLLRLASALNVSVDYLIMASDVATAFDADELAKNVAQNLMENEALMFSADCYTDVELAELSAVIQSSVKAELSRHVTSVKGGEN